MSSSPGSFGCTGCRCPLASLVALLTWRDLLLCAKHLFVAAKVAIAAAI